MYLRVHLNIYPCLYKNPCMKGKWATVRDLRVGSVETVLEDKDLRRSCERREVRSSETLILASLVRDVCDKRFVEEDCLNSILEYSNYMYVFKCFLLSEVHSG